MDMEMNAELERDGGSEAGEASTEGSSAGSAYCSLETDFAKITTEMKINESLAAYEGEYTRLFEALYKSHRLEEELREQCRLLKEEVEKSNTKISELEKSAESNAENIDLLKNEIMAGMKLADAAHTREQKAQEVIENLRVSIQKLTEELEMKNKQLSVEDPATASKQKDGAAKDKERLLGEVEALRQRLKTVTAFNQELEGKYSEADQRATELQEKIDKMTNDMSKDRRERENMESELHSIEDELRSKLMELETAEETLKTMTANSSKQDNLLKEQIAENDKNQKEIEKLMLKQLAMTKLTDKMNARNEKLRKDLFNKNKEIKELTKEIFKLKEECQRLETEKSNVLKKLITEKNNSLKIEENLKRMTANMRSADLEVAALKKQADGDKKTMEKMLREKDALAKSNTTLEDLNKKLTLEIRVCEQANRKMETTLDQMTESSNEMKRQMKNLEKDRDRCIMEVQELTQQVEDYMDEVKIKRLEISDYQKRLLEGEAKLRQQQTLFEDVRAERNSYKKNLTMAQDEMAELKNKMKNLTQLFEHTKDQLAEKEAALLKMEFLFSKNEKDKEQLKSDLQESRKNMSDLRHEMNELLGEQKRLRSTLQQADLTISRQKKEIESVMNERDMIGAQIVRRNDEMSLQYNKMQILNETLARGEKQYAQRLEDIRMLRLEVKNLKMDKAALEKNTANLNDLRGEVFQLERNLTKERLKVMALEEEVQNPLNVHRWRNLEGIDPDTFELMKKIQFLQKRLLKMSAEMLAKEKKIKETEKLYMNLREIISKQPGPDVLVCLSKTRRALRDRGKKMKCLVAELNMTLATEQKFEIDKLKRELNVMKMKYLTQKKKEFKAAAEPTKENLPSITSSQTKFLGGGFNLSAPITKASSTPLITINK